MSVAGPRNQIQQMRERRRLPIEKAGLCNRPFCFFGVCLLLWKRSQGAEWRGAERWDVEPWGGLAPAGPRRRSGVLQVAQVAQLHVGSVLGIQPFAGR
jgi:hypothetical protein